MRLAPNWYQIGNKIRYILKVSKFYVEEKISMLPGLKVSSLASKLVFYRSEHNPKGGPNEIEFCWSSNAKTKCSNG